MCEDKSVSSTHYRYFVTTDVVKINMREQMFVNLDLCTVLKAV